MSARFKRGLVAAVAGVALAMSAATSAQAVTLNGTYSCEGDLVGGAVITTDSSGGYVDWSPQ